MLARYRGSKATNEIYTFTPSKIIFPSPENFLSDRSKQRARQISCATKNNNPTRVFSPQSLSLKWYWLYSFERITIFTTNISKIVLFSRQIFWKLYSYSFHYYSFKYFENIFLSIYQMSTLLKIISLLEKSLYQLKILSILMIKYSSLDTLYTYIGYSGLAHPTLHFPNMHAFLNNGKRPESR